MKLVELARTLYLFTNIILYDMGNRIGEIEVHECYKPEYRDCRVVHIAPVSEESVLVTIDKGDVQ